jgi:putative toxin-antitoxin system antitoxin component (TIGR02293 family)
MAPLLDDLIASARRQGLNTLAYLLEMARRETGQNASSASQTRPVASEAIPANADRDPDTLARHLEIHVLAHRVFGNPQKAEAWLARPNASLGGQTPADLLGDELGAAVVRETLEQIDQGIFA